MKRFSRHDAAFSLVEVAIAIAITSFCLIALLGLLPVGMRSNEASIEQTGANGVLSEVIADLRATPATMPPGAAATSQHFAIPIPANPVTASPAATVIKFTSAGQSSAETSGVTDPWIYLVTITFLPNTNPKTASMARLQVSWPASVAFGNAAGSVQTFVALDRN